MFFVVYARIYGSAFLDAVGAIGRNAWTLLLPMGLLLAIITLSALVAPLGIVGGFLLSLAMTAASSIYSYFVANVVAKNRVGFSDFRKSVLPYLWSWMNLFFVLWIVDLLLGGVVTANPRGPQLLAVISLMKLVVLNPAPEVIYLKGSYGGLETIQRSFRFLQENWIEWFVPNGLILAAWWFLRDDALRLLSAFPLAIITVPVLLGALVHVLMVYRGFLFEVLDQSTHRQRMFRFRGKL